MKPFDKARILSFTDAVFSIAMTLLVLELAIPSGKMLLKYGTMNVLSSLIPAFIGLLVSFLVTAVFWTANLRLMQYVKVFDDRLLWINIFLLLFVVLLPFSTAFYVQGISMKGPFIFYALNLVMLALFNYLLIRYAIKLSDPDSELKGQVVGPWLKAKALNALLIWTLAALVGFFFLELARFLFVLIFIIDWFVAKHFNKRLAKIPKTSNK